MTQQIIDTLDSIERKVTNSVGRLEQNQQEFAQRLVAIEQKGAAGGTPPEASARPSALRTFLESPQLKALRGGAPTTGRVELPGGLAETKALLSFQGAQVTTNQFNVGAQRLPGFAGLAQRPLSILDVLMRMPVTSNALEYNRLHSSFSHAANFQTYESDAKPEQNVPTTLVTAPITTVAAFVRGSRQVLSDDALLMQQVGALITYGVMQKLEAAIVAGAAGAGQITGLWTAGTTITATGAQADRVGSAIAQLRAAGWNPGLIVLHPTDWFEIASERATGLEYVSGGWATPAGPSMWGLPVVTTPSLTVNNCLVIDPAQVAILDREGITVMVSSEDGTNFTTNQMTILAELRAGLAIFAPGAVGKVTLSP